MNCPYYNRYTDKTQVFSLYKNDDISRRALHVQLVSRIARNIGRLLGLNLDLIEAIALGHDMGHTPFGHAGESILSKLYHKRTGRFFNHNVHSVRVLDRIFHYNISLQTLDGILCHNGELELDEYRPSNLSSFDEFDKIFEDCYTKDCSGMLIPSTLEGCIVRISDIIAYLGKDRQDAERAKLITDNSVFNDNAIGAFNAKII
ncbi:MAG: HD domain-containing protein, partial [Clostridia bacterium]|nr:HD domain-containing protein [Clostridia bacterium]